MTENGPVYLIGCSNSKRNYLTVVVVVVLLQMIDYYMMYTGRSSWRLALVMIFVLVTTTISVASGRDAYFNGTTEATVGSVTFPPTSSQFYHLGFSFRSCGAAPATGTIFQQVR